MPQSDDENNPATLNTENTQTQQASHQQRVNSQTASETPRTQRTRLVGYRHILRYVIQSPVWVPLTIVTGSLIFIGGFTLIVAGVVTQTSDSKLPFMASGVLLIFFSFIGVAVGCNYGRRGVRPGDRRYNEHYHLMNMHVQACDSYRANAPPNYESVIKEKHTAAKKDKADRSESLPSYETARNFTESSTKRKWFSQKVLRK